MQVHILTTSRLLNTIVIPLGMRSLIWGLECMCATILIWSVNCYFVICTSNRWTWWLICRLCILWLAHPGDNSAVIGAVAWFSAVEPTYDIKPDWPAVRDDDWPRAEEFHGPVEPDLPWRHDARYAPFYAGYGYAVVASSLRMPSRTRSWSSLSSLSPSSTSLLWSYFLTLKITSDLSVRGVLLLSFILSCIIIFHFAFLDYFMLLLFLFLSFFFIA